MGRTRTLTDEERIENRKNLDSHPITIKVTKSLKERLDTFSKKYTSRNAAILDLIKTHPNFKKTKDYGY